MLLHTLGQRLRKDTASLGKGVAKEDSVGESGCVTTSPHPSHPLDGSLPYLFLLWLLRYFPSAPLAAMPLLWDPILGLGSGHLGLVLGGC